jgi:hypothetical protein
VDLVAFYTLALLLFALLFFTLERVVERSDLKIFFEDYLWKQNLSRVALKIVVMTREQGTGNREQGTGNS